MSEIQYPIITQFKLTTFEDRDFGAFELFPTTGISTEKEYRDVYKNMTGYNPGSPARNDQICKVCKKGGPECIGHPVIYDLRKVGLFLSEFGVETIKLLTKVICAKCETIVKHKDYYNEVKGPLVRNLQLKELAALEDNQKICECITETPSGDIPASPSFEIMEEKKKDEEDREFAWKKGKYVEKREKKLELTFKERDIKERIERVNLAPLGFSKKEKQNILNLFYNRAVLLPPNYQAMSFKRGQNTGVNEVTETMKSHQDLYFKIKTLNLSSIREKLRQYAVGEDSGKYTSNPSHVTVSDGKKGIYRGTASNKRPSGTGRAVATKGGLRACNLSIPYFLHDNLMYEYKVCDYNRDWLQSKVGGAVSHYVNINENSSTNMMKKFLKIAPGTILKLGETVLKKPEDGDFACCSRQPILHKHSLIGYRVSLWKNFCIGLPEQNTHGHAADFDGDEINLQVLADLMGRIETQMLDSLYNIFGSKAGEPVIQILYNGIVGAFVLSTEDNMEEEIFNQLVNIIEGKDIKANATDYITEFKIDKEYYRRKAENMAAKYPNENIHYLSGRTLISMLLPKYLRFFREGDDKKGEPDVFIEEGYLIKGKLRKKDLVNLILAINQQDRWRLPFMFLDRGYAVMSAFISMQGFTISAEDYILPKTTMMVNGLEVGVNKRNWVLPRNYKYDLEIANEDIMKLEKIKKTKTKASALRIENDIVFILDRFKARNMKLLDTSPFGRCHLATISYKSNARGDHGNIMSVVSSIGQIYGEGEMRVGADTTRLSHYDAPGSLSIYANGYIEEDYTGGLSPASAMKVAGPARLMAFRTFLGTPESGNASRQIVLHLSGIIVNASLSVINRTGRTIDCLSAYGNDSTTISSKNGVLGNIESAVDALALLDYVNAADET